VEVATAANAAVTAGATLCCMVTVREIGSGAVMGTNRRSYSCRDLTTIPAVQGSIMRIAGEELERVAVDNVLMMIVDLRRKEG